MPVTRSSGTHDCALGSNVRAEAKIECLPLRMQTAKIVGWRSFATLSNYEIATESDRYFGESVTTPFAESMLMVKRSRKSRPSRPSPAPATS